MDWSTRFPDLCWFFVCEYLSISDIAQLSSTCRTLRHLLWLCESLFWAHLIHVRCCSSTFSQSILTLFDQDQDDNASVSTMINLSKDFLVKLVHIDLPSTSVLLLFLVLVVITRDTVNLLHQGAQHAIFLLINEDIILFRCRD